MNILITGANGFLGSWLCRVALENQANQIFAAVRAGSDLSKLPISDRLRILTIDYSTKEGLDQFFVQFIERQGKLDLLIHNAGVTKANSREANFSINEGLTRKLVAAIEQNAQLKDVKFAYVSSQAALGPVAMNGPVSSYGESKLAAEQTIKSSSLKYFIFRPTGIYGPGDMAFLDLFKSVNMRIYPCAASINQKVTLIHAYDVAQNILAISQGNPHKTIHLSDTNTYLHRDIKKAMEKSLHKKAMMLKLPNWITKSYLIASEQLGKLFGFDPILTIEKHGEISKDWDHDFTSERKEIPLKIKFDLQRGFDNTVEYYKSQNLL